LDETQFLITDKSQRLDQYEAEFGALVNPDRVQITWNGIASLWACAQGIGRLARRMFEAQRAGADRLYLNNDPELENGLYFYELTRRLAKHRFDRWVDWLPFPNVAPTERDDQLGNRLFLAALGWIARHELAHIALHHHAQLDAKSITRYNAEIEADKQGSQWAKQGLQTDNSRPASQKPSTEELQLEWRALAAGVGLLWVGLFEEASRSPSPGYPKIAERIFASFDIFDLPEDSFASEIFSYSVKAWIDPQGDWGIPADRNEATAKAAFAAAVIRLHRHMGNL
jgi:Peptidase U49